ncbi:hypothetical protein EVAR_42377_1 [Eumeta japonica]|uniref:DDE Tnp4 domain-containing protein n=1 Tax=Eumeta variegata TaxID=151549 RepID=A0A4C1YJI0_EUMVA|nr:hypothetical protein EVAR_42377_1 [Eumeta japonica]
MENYTEYRVMGSVSKIRMKADCLPSKFGCQPDRKRRTDIKTTRSLPAKRQKLKTIEEYEREIEQVESTQRFSMAEVQPGPSSDVLQPMDKLITTDKSIRVCIYHKLRSKSTQTQTTYRNIAISPRKNLATSISTSPLKVEEMSSISGHTKISKKLCFSIEEHSDSDVSLFTPSLARSNSSLTSSEQMKASSETSSLNEEVKNLELDQIVHNTIKKIKKRPRRKYHHVSCIIDCLEIEIQKPSNAVHQALTWSDYKKANTLKYLISSTPDGLVNFISPG